MGLFGNLFEKKNCDVCGEEIKLLGNRKLEDGNLCKNCASKLSPWFDERRHSTVDQIKEQLAYREANKSKVSAFRASGVYGQGSQKLYVDTAASRFTVASDKDFSGGNPDILDFSQATSCELDIKENKHEEKRTVDGKSVSYVPPRYKYSYDFYVTIRVNNPYFDDMKFKINSMSVDTGTTCMTTGGNAGWKLTPSNGIFGNNGINKYNECISIGDSIKSMVTGWMNPGMQGGLFGQQPMNQGFGQQNMQGGFGQQPMNQGFGQQGGYDQNMNQGIAQQALQGNYGQPNMNQGYPQQGMQNGFAQPDMTQGFAQQNMNQGYPQQGMQGGYGQQPMNQGIAQQALQGGYGQQAAAPAAAMGAGAAMAGAVTAGAQMTCPFCDAVMTPVAGKCPICEGVL